MTIRGYSFELKEVCPHFSLPSLRESTAHGAVYLICKA